MNRPLKISMVASVVLSVAGVAVGWHGHQTLESSRARNARAVSQAAALGISVGTLGKKDAAPVTRRERESSEEAAKREAAELFALLKEGDAAEQDETDAIFEKALGRLMTMGPEATEMLVRQVLEDKQLTPDNRGGLLSLLLSKLMEDNPRAVLRLLPDISGISGDEREDKRAHDLFLGTSLTNWGKKDPRAVGKWIRENGHRFPGAINDSVKMGVLSGTATRDPGLALDLMDEMDIEDKDRALIVIVRAVKTPKERTTTLAEIRARFSRSPGKDPDEGKMRSAVRELAVGTLQGGYESATGWFESASLDPAEMTVVGSVLEYHHTYKETGRWLDWLGKSLPADKAGEPIGRIMTQWTELDYQAAGKWLAAAPEGLAKNASVQAYAAAVSKYEPGTAVQWAMTLPAGKDRDATLRQIHQNWPKEQTAARDAFAKEHGIQ